MIRIGSLFSGIGGFELGLERSIPNSETIWQVEQNPFCQRVLKQHWPDATIYDDVCSVGKHNLEPVDILCGGFPCQDISIAGAKGGINASRSGLWWEMCRVISELEPPVIVLENVPNVLRLGGREVLGSLADIGYDAEWTIISAGQFGAPHLRKRWFCVGYRTTLGYYHHSKNGMEAAYSGGDGPRQATDRRSVSSVGKGESVQQRRQEVQTTNTNTTRPETRAKTVECLEETGGSKDGELLGYPRLSTLWNQKRASDWGGIGPQSSVCRVDDGVPDRVDRIRALGNAIVPQCSELVGHKIQQSKLWREYVERRVCQVSETAQ